MNPGATNSVTHDFAGWHLAGLLDAAAARFPDHPFIGGPNPLPYRTAAAQTRRLAAALQARGLKRGDRVVILTANRPEVGLLSFAVARLAAIFVVLNNQLKSFGLQQILEQCAPTIVVLDESTAPLAGDIKNAKIVFLGENKPASAEATYAELLQTPDPGPQNFPGIDLDPVCLLFTSGSTGKPRGVTLSHDNIRFVVAAIQERLQYQPADIVGIFLPLSFDYGLYQLFLAAQAGATAFVGQPEMIGPQILRILTEQKISVLPGVPALFAAMLKMMERSPAALPALRAVTNTGDKLPQAYIDQLLKFFPKLRVFPMYGLTECKRVSILLPEEMAARPGSVGRALAGTEVYVVDEEGRRLPPGELGELVVRGRNVALGYWRAEEETRQRYRQNIATGLRELYSGDSCVVDADGYIYFHGRKDTLFKHRGFRISPLEIEAAACAIPGVNEAGVVKSDADGLLYLFVSVKDKDLGAPQVTAELQKRLEPVKIPDRIQVIAELPKTANRKVDRLLLKQQLVA
jgi:amino acid adenylation domain-containing protein